MSGKAEEDDARSVGTDTSEEGSDDEVDELPMRGGGGGGGGAGDGRLRERRGTVAAAVLTMDESWEPPVHPKSEEEEARILHSVAKNALFQALGDKEKGVLVKAFRSVSFSAGEVIISQGEDGDQFYVMDSGKCAVDVEGIGHVMDCVPEEEKDNVDDDPDAVPKRNFFGELALLYGAPRAATVRCETDVTAWALDQETFKRTLTGSAMRQRTTYREFLEHVPLLSTLTQYERLTIADSLEAREYSTGDVILSQGAEGAEFFIVEEGEVKCVRGNSTEEVSGRLRRGDFFGELALLNDDRRQATVIATQNTRCLVLGRDTFKRLFGPLEEHLKANAEMYTKYVDSVDAEDGKAGEGK